MFADQARDLQDRKIVVLRLGEGAPRKGQKPGVPAEVVDQQPENRRADEQGNVSPQSPGRGRRPGSRVGADIERQQDRVTHVETRDFKQPSVNAEAGTLVVK